MKNSPNDADSWHTKLMQYRALDSKGNDITNVIGLHSGEFIDRTKAHYWKLIKQTAQFSLLYPGENFLLQVFNTKRNMYDNRIYIIDGKVVATLGATSRDHSQIDAINDSLKAYL